MNARIAIRFETSTGHRLHLHEGDCNRLHGHNYQIEIEILGAVGATTGMVMDFADLKALVRGSMMEFMDHRTLISRDDPLADHLHDVPGVRLVSFLPTAEALAQHLWTISQRALNTYNEIRDDKVSTGFVRVRETESYYAQV